MIPRGIWKAGGDLGGVKRELLLWSSSAFTLQSPEDGEKKARVGRRRQPEKEPWDVDVLGRERGRGTSGKGGAPRGRVRRVPGQRTQGGARVQGSLRLGCAAICRGYHNRASDDGYRGLGGLHDRNVFSEGWKSETQVWARLASSDAFLLGG